MLIACRDGRDILISQYFHSLFRNERCNSRLVVELTGDVLDFERAKTIVDDHSFEKLVNKILTIF